MKQWRVGVLLGVGGCALLAGCARDPATEAPVQLRPGLYKASLQGRGDGPFSTGGPSELQKEVCVGADRAEFFPQMYVRQYLAMGEQCDGPLTERAGNQIKGKVICPLGDSVRGQFVTSFEGAVSEEEVNVAAVTRLENLSGSPEQLAELEKTPLTGEGIDLQLTIARVGDCAA